MGNGPISNAHSLYQYIEILVRKMFEIPESPCIFPTITAV